MDEREQMEVPSASASQWSEADDGLSASELETPGEERVTSRNMNLTKSTPEKGNFIEQASKCAPRFISKFAHHSRAKHGDSITLDCRIKGNPTPKITWEIGGKPAIDSSTSFENGKAALTINSVNERHSGKVVCKAANTEGESVHEGTLVVEDGSKPPSFAEELPQEISIAVGEEINLQCQILGRPEPEVKWIKNGKPLSYSLASFRNGRANFQIKNTRAEDKGKYECIAWNANGRKSSFCNITVIAESEARQRNSFSLKREFSTTATKPTLLNSECEDFSSTPKAPEFTSGFPERIRATEGEAVKLECKVSGTPEPAVRWLISGRLIDDADSKYEGGHAVLTIPSITEGHFGFVECVAKNIAGESSSLGIITKRQPSVASTGMNRRRRTTRFKSWNFRVVVSNHCTEVQSGVIYNMDQGCYIYSSVNVDEGTREGEVASKYGEKLRLQQVTETDFGFDRIYSSVLKHISPLIRLQLDERKSQLIVTNYNEKAGVTVMSSSSSDVKLHHITSAERPISFAPSSTENDGQQVVIIELIGGASFPIKIELTPVNE